MGNRALCGNAMHSKAKDIQAHTLLLSCLLYSLTEKKYFFPPPHYTWSIKIIIFQAEVHNECFAFPVNMSPHLTIHLLKTLIPPCGLNLTESHTITQQCSMKASTPTSNASKHVIKIVQQRR